MKEWIRSQVSPLRRELVFVLPIIILLIHTFVELAEELREWEAIRMDTRLLLLVASLRTPWLTEWMKGITELGSVLWLTAGTAAVSLVLLFRKRLMQAILFMLGMLATSGANTALKSTYARERPDQVPLIPADGYSFPSGHAMGAISLYGFLLYFTLRSQLSSRVKREFALLWTGLILLIGFSRIYLGVHYPIDVAAGFSSGGAILILTIALIEWADFWNRMKGDLRAASGFNPRQERLSDRGG